MTLGGLGHISPNILYQKIFVLNLNKGGSMAGPLNATIVMAKCSKTKKLFGMRVEQRGNDWIRTWAFPLDEEKARNEGFDKNKLSISGVDNDYPGCPHCGDGGFTKCTCSKIGCSGATVTNEGKMSYICPWCGKNISVTMSNSIDASGGGY